MHWTPSLAFLVASFPALRMKSWWEFILECWQFWNMYAKDINKFKWKELSTSPEWHVSPTKGKLWHWSWEFPGTPSLTDIEALPSGLKRPVPRSHWPKYPTWFLQGQGVCGWNCSSGNITLTKISPPMSRQAVFVAIIALVDQEVEIFRRPQP